MLTERRRRSLRHPGGRPHPVLGAGLGLGLVEAIRGEVGWEALDRGGKLVWAQLDVTREEGPGSVPRPRDGATDPLRTLATGAPVSAPQHPAPTAAAPALPAAAVPAAAPVGGEIGASRLGTGVLAAALQALPDGVAIFDREWTIDYVNPVGGGAARPAGRRAGGPQHLGRAARARRHRPSKFPAARPRRRRAGTWAGFYPPAGRWLSVTAGTLDGLLQVTFRATDGGADLPAAAGTGVELAATDAEADGDRLGYLAEVTETLIGTLDTGESATRLAELAARGSATGRRGWCGGRTAGGARAATHRDPARRRDVDTYRDGRLR